MDQMNLKNADLMLLSSLTQAPAANPDSMLGELCLSVAVTLRNNGSVLIPCYPSGVVYDLFECLSSHLDSTALGQIPMYFISPVAHSSLEYSNILAEWSVQIFFSLYNLNKTYLNMSIYIICLGCHNLNKIKYTSQKNHFHMHNW